MKLKVYASLIITLILGMVIGFFIFWGMHSRKIERSMFSSTKYGFKDRLYMLIEPSVEQQKALDPIICKYGKRIQKLTIDYKKNIHRTMDSLDAEITPILNPRQIELIQKEMKRRIRRESKIHKYLKKSIHDDKERKEYLKECNGKHGCS